MIEQSKPETSVHLGQYETTPGLMKTETTNLERIYGIRFKTLVVLFFMGLTWGTCTLANVGPSTTYTYAVAELGDSAIEAWIPNGALIPLIGLQPIWVSDAPPHKGNRHIAEHL